VNSSSVRADQVAAFYESHAERLRHIVGAKARAPEHVLEDAAQTAWVALVRREDISLDDHGMSWLSKVAIHEGWRLASTARELPISGVENLNEKLHDADVPELVDALTPGTDEQAIARAEDANRLVYLRRLKPREREALTLKALGYSYNEIADLTNASHTAVNRRLAEGRARLREMTSDQANGGPNEDA
jgi:RNA polymerase sigma factor (sigma-70 family)